MCTIGALASGERTFLFKNFDYPPFPAGWAQLHSFDQRLEHFALVNHDQQGVNSGLNSAGLGLLISRSKCLQADTPERQELRTVLNGQILANCREIKEGVNQIEAFARTHPQMLGGNVMLAEAGRIAVVEYFGGEARSELIEKGYVARANHSVFGLVENATPDSSRRFELMNEFLQDLFVWLPTLDRDDVIERGRNFLRQEPVFNKGTRSSCIIDIESRQVDWAMGAGPWRIFSLAREQA